jgi:dipeptidyl aminopeptidase/acylaminoacyl peptidase
MRLASLAVLVQTGDAPSLILHGTIDDVVPFHQAELLVDAMKRAGNEVTLIPMAGVNHGAQSPMLPGNDDPFGTRDAVVEFFTRHLGPVSPQG